MLLVSSAEEAGNFKATDRMIFEIGSLRKRRVRSGRLQLRNPKKQ